MHIHVHMCIYIYASNMYVSTCMYVHIYIYMYNMCEDLASCARYSEFLAFMAWRLRRTPGLRRSSTRAAAADGTVERRLGPACGRGKAEGLVIPNPWAFWLLGGLIGSHGTRPVQSTRICRVVIMVVDRCLLFGCLHPQGKVLDMPWGEP